MIIFQNIKSQLLQYFSNVKFMKSETIICPVTYKSGDVNVKFFDQEKSRFKFMT